MPGMEFWQIISKCESLWCSYHSCEASASLQAGIIYRQVALDESEAVTLLGLKAITRDHKLEGHSSYIPRN